MTREQQAATVLATLGVLCVEAAAYACNPLLALAALGAVLVVIARGMVSR